MFGIGLTSAIIIKYPNSYRDIDFPRRLFAFILIFDIFAGCIANFTVSTNNYYAKSKRKRLIFIIVHVHLLVISFLINKSISKVLLVWMYTIICSLIINEIQSKNQVFFGGLLLCTGVGWIQMLEMETYMNIISTLFMVKVLFSFSVNHYRNNNEISIKKE